MKYKLTNQLKKIFIFFWNFFTTLNYSIYKNKKNKFQFNFNVSKLKKIKVLIIKPFYYTDLYSPVANSEIEMIASSQYRMGPLGLILNFDTEIVISQYKNDKKLNFDNINFKNRESYLRSQYEEAIDFHTFNFNKYDWVISIKDSVPSSTIRQHPDILWSKLYEDHREIFYLSDNYLGSPKYDLTLDTTQGFTPYDFLKNNKSISFPYSFGNTDTLSQMKFEKRKEEQLVTEVYQPTTLSFETIEEIKVFNTKGNLKTLDYLRLLSNSKYFYCPIYELPRWGNSIIEAATFNCLVVGNPNSFWNSLIIQKECVAKNHNEGLKIIKKFQKHKDLYHDVLQRQTQTLNQINYNLPLNNILNMTKKKLKNKKILRFF